MRLRPEHRLVVAPRALACGLVPFVLAGALMTSACTQPSEKGADAATSAQPAAGIANVQEEASANVQAATAPDAQANAQAATAPDAQYADAAHPSKADYPYLDQNVFIWEENFDDAELFPASDEHGTWGYVDREGAWAITPQFDYASPLKDGYGLVYKETNDEYTPYLIDSAGNDVLGVPCTAPVHQALNLIYGQGLDPREQYAKIERFVQDNPLVNEIYYAGEGLFGVTSFSEDEENHGCAIIRGDLSFVHDFTPDLWRPMFSEGLCPYGYKPQSQTVGYLDREGTVTVTPGDAMECGAFENGYATAQATKDGLYGIIDKTGKWVVEPRFAFLGDFRKGEASATGPDLLTGTVDTAGNWVVKPTNAYDFIYKIHDDRYLAQSSQGYDLIDKTGLVLAHAHGMAVHFSNQTETGRIVVTDTGGASEACVFDRDGTYLIPPGYLGVNQVARDTYTCIEDYGDGIITSYSLVTGDRRVIKHERSTAPGVG